MAENIDQYKIRAGQDWRVWGDDYNRTNQLAYNMFREVMGRDPSAEEFSQVMPYFHGQGSQGQWTGRAYLNQMLERERMDPTDPRNPYNPRNPDNRIAEYSQPINDVFNELLKRGASQSEIDHFGQLLGSGQLDAFTLRNYVSQLPEFRQAEDKRFREGVASEMEGYDTKAFDKQKQNLLAYYARNGMPSGTSASLDYAMTDLMGKIAENRQKFLTGISAEQYQGNKGAARADYEYGRDRMFSDLDYNRNRRAGMSDYLTGRMGERQDYQQQMGDYMDYLGSQRRGGNKWGTLLGGALGAGIGGFLGKSPQSYQTGWQIGSGIGGGFDYMNY